MSGKLLVGICLCAGVLAGTVDTHADVQHLLPKVKVMEQTEDAPPLSLSTPLTINDPTETSALQLYLGECGATIVPSGGIAVNVEIVNSIPGAFNHKLADFPDEAYRLVITADGIEIKALTTTGVIRAAQTISQLAMERDHSLPAVDITDWPAFKMRGYMHDVGRSFIDINTLRKHIDLLARFKVNTFHWHLTENQAWRFEVKAYPQLTSTSSMTRFAGKYYTQQECRDLVKYASERGVIVIPEIDMPGHSEAFTRAMGHSMQTAQGVEELKTILEEVADVFADAPYIHIGADEVSITYPNFLKTMTDKVHSLGHKVVVWNPISGVTISKSIGADMTTMWGSAGKKISGLSNVDMRYNYINHFDVFADVVGIYRSQIYYEPKGTSEVAGAVTAIWNDRKTPTEEDIITQNNFYANALVTCERAWIGGGKQYIEVGGAVLPTSGDEYEEFADWERRFLYHKNTTLAGEPIPYVKQCNVRWRITDPMPNGGVASTKLPPELEEPATSYEYKGQTYGTRIATGAGIYLRHTWGTVVPALFASHTLNTTSYAYTYIYSPVEQEAGALIEFQNYGRSEVDTAPDKGKWDRKGSDIWLNDVRIDPPVWVNSGKTINREVDLANENFTARKPSRITLKQGWNKVLIKLPYLNASGVRLNKWMFTFVVTDIDGKDALPDLVYSPNKILDTRVEEINLAIEDALAYRNQYFKDVVGYYDPELAAEFDALVAEIQDSFDENLSAEERAAQLSRINEALNTLKDVAKTAAIVQPRTSTISEPYIYYLSTPNRDSRYVTGAGNGAVVYGQAKTSKSAGWIFVKRTDGTYDLVNYSDNTYLSPASSNNTALYTRSAQPSAGWSVKPSSQIGLVIITSGTVQLNQTNSSLAYKVYNWGDGKNTTDTGCQYLVSHAQDLQATGIEDIATENSDAPQAVYDLLGRRINDTNLTPGLYIINGQKMIVR